MNRILVIGGTGNIGSKVVAQLTAAGINTRVMVRNPEMARLPQQVEVFRGDLIFPDTVNESLRDIEAVFLVWTAPPESAAPVLERIARHVRRIVYLSAPIKTPHPFFQASLPNPMSLLHEEIERLIKKSGVEYTFLRPGMLTSNAIEWWAPQIRIGDIVRWPYLAAPTAPIDESDIASVAISALLDKDHADAEYVLTGPQSLSQFEQISAIGNAIGRELKIEEISPKDAEREWAPTWPVYIKNMLLQSWKAAMGQPAYVSNTVAEVTGTPARIYFDWVSDNAHMFRA